MMTTEATPGALGSNDQLGGWYECINNWDDYTEVAIHEGEPSHWMPLPAPPVWMPLPAPPVSA